MLALGEKMSPLVLFMSLKLLGIKNTEEDAFDSLSPSKCPLGRILFLYFICVMYRIKERRRERVAYIERGDSPKFCIVSSKLNRGGSAEGVDLICKLILFFVLFFFHKDKGENVQLER